MPSRLAMIAAVALGMSCTAQAQNKIAPTPDATPASKSAPPSADTQIYRNSTFGFRYQIPYGWVNRTQVMNEPDAHYAPLTEGQSQSQAEAQSKSKDKREPAGAGKGEVLLAVFERPPEASGDTINSAVVIASESAASYPGLKKAEDYLGPLRELTMSKGFKTEGDPSIIEIDARRLVRIDFSKPLGIKTNNDSTVNDQLTMLQATLVLLAKGQIVSFTFIAGSEDELGELMDGLHFGVTKSPAR